MWAILSASRDGYKSSVRVPCRSARLSRAMCGPKNRYSLSSLRASSSLAVRDDDDDDDDGGGGGGGGGGGATVHTTRRESFALCVLLVVRGGHG